MELNNMNIKEIKKLVNLVEEANVSHLSLEHEGTKIEIKKELQTLPQQFSTQIPMAAPIVEQKPQTAQPTAPIETDKKTSSSAKDITAQMVGTFYASADPESPPFIKVGDSVKKGQTLCIIEAMKLFNEIESEVDGEITEICVKNGDAVEFGQVLFRLK